VPARSATTPTREKLATSITPPTRRGEKKLTHPVIYIGELSMYLKHTFSNMLLIFGTNDSSKHALKEIGLVNYPRLRRSLWAF